VDSPDSRKTEGSAIWISSVASEIPAPYDAAFLFEGGKGLGWLYGALVGLAVDALVIAIFAATYQGFDYSAADWDEKWGS
jgi:glycerol-3-phosphate acyltransferase PlsY